MGITIHYRGTIDDMSQVEAMEDRVLDLVFALGGRATIWRSYADHDPKRVVRGLMVNLEPGQETLSLLISPEGHLLPLFQIEEAEKGPFEESPYCFVKTQFGSPQGHIAIVQLLDALRQGYFSDLHVSDEGEYYETRDYKTLLSKWEQIRSGLQAIVEGLKGHGLSAEAAEDPEIVATRIERIVRLVQSKLLEKPPRASEPANEDFSEDSNAMSLEDEVEAMDRLQRKSNARSERMIRRISEATAEGLTSKQAFELAMKEEGLIVPEGESESPLDSESPSDSEPSEPWIDSLTPHSFDDSEERKTDCNHPAVLQATTFLEQVMELNRNPSRSTFVSLLERAARDMVGGLVQATSRGWEDQNHRALAITQLKRALSGHAYARGAIFGLRGEKAITEVESKRFHEQLQALLDTIHELSERAWG